MTAYFTNIQKTAHGTSHESDTSHDVNVYYDEI